MAESTDKKRRWQTRHIIEGDKQTRHRLNDWLCERNVLHPFFPRFLSLSTMSDFASSYVDIRSRSPLHVIYIYIYTLRQWYPPLGKFMMHIPAKYGNEQSFGTYINICIYTYIFCRPRINWGQETDLNLWFAQNNLTWFTHILCPTISMRHVQHFLMLLPVNMSPQQSLQNNIHPFIFSLSLHFLSSIRPVCKQDKPLFEMKKCCSYNLAVWRMNEVIKKYYLLVAILNHCPQFSSAQRI